MTAFDHIMQMMRPLAHRARGLFADPFTRGERRAELRPEQLLEQRPELRSAAAQSCAGFGDAVVVSLDGRGLMRGAVPAFFPAVSGDRSFASIFLAEERRRIAAAIDANAPSKITARARRRDGAVGVFELYVEPSRAGVDVFLIDRTEAAAEADRLRRDVDRARTEARAIAARLADLSHEMKTPLNAVIGFAETIETEAFGPAGNEKYTDYATHIRTAGVHLLDLVTSLLDLARLDADRLSLRALKVEPLPLAEECAAMVRGIAEAAGLAVTVSTSDDASLPTCFFDPRAVRQILLNLLSNAIKFTSDGEIRLTVDMAGDDAIVFTVIDTGIGMNASDLAKLGPRYTDAQGDGVRGAAGAGLGLALAIRLARLHGGDIRFDSAPGEGLTARVVLPIDCAAELAAAPASVGVADDFRPDDAALEEERSNAVLTQQERIEAYRRASAVRRGAVRAA